MFKHSSDLRALALLVGLGAVVVANAGSPQKPKQAKPTVSKAVGHQMMTRHEAKFYENKGQWNNHGQFLTRRSGADIWFEDKGIDFDYYITGGTQNKPSRAGQVISMQLVGGSFPLKFQGGGYTGSRNDYITPRGTYRQAKGYGELLAKNAFPGIDFRGYYLNGDPRYDFIVKPGAEPKSVKLAFKGADKVSVKDGKILLSTHIGIRSQGDLHVYQIISGERVPVPAKFVALTSNQVGLKVGAYDKSIPLVIDPLIYGSYYGADGNWDSVQGILGDAASGGVYMTGYTQCANFPAIFGPYSYNLSGQRNAFVSKLQGDAFNQDYAAFIGGSDQDTGIAVKMDPFGNIWIAGASTSSDFPGNTSHRVNKMIVSGSLYPGDSRFTATNGTFYMTYQTYGGRNYGPDPMNGQQSVAIPWNATAAQVQADLNKISQIAGQVTVSEINGQTLPNGGIYEIDLPVADPGILVCTSTRLLDNNGNELSQGLPFTVADVTNPVTNPTNPSPVTVQTLKPEGSNYVDTAANQGFFTLTFTSLAGVTATTPTTGAMALNVHTATAGVIQAALVALGGVGAGNVTVQDLGVQSGRGGSTGTIETDAMRVTFGGTIGAAQFPLIVTPLSFSPEQVLYHANTNPYTWVMKFAQDPNTVLNPLPTQSFVFGNSYGFQLSSFDIKPESNPSPTDPVDMIFGGTTLYPIPEFPGMNTRAPYNFINGVEQGFVARMSYAPSTGFTLNSASSLYLAAGGGGTGTRQIPVNNRGVVFDSAGNFYTVGTVYGDKNYNTASLPVFPTTSGIFLDGNLLRFSDIYVQKYNTTGQLVWSGLVGGHNNDFAGGYFYDPDGTDVSTGSAVAVDSAGSVYITGISQSYDFPRTRNVYGEVFTDAYNVTVTKISSDGTTILYSSNLNVSEPDVSGRPYMIPAGISVDSQGDTFITGNGLPRSHFIDDNGAPGGSPTEAPTGETYPSIPTTSDALLPTFTPVGEPACQFGWLNVLNADATQLLYGTYLGSGLESRVYAPYVDALSHVWVCGWVDSHRQYLAPGATTITYQDSALPGSMISSDAFKPVQDTFYPGFTSLFAWGADDSDYGFVIDPLSVNNPAYPGQPYESPGIQAVPYISALTFRDGFVAKLAVGIPVLQSLTFSPGTIAGGFGQFSTGTLTLTAPAQTNDTINLSITSGSQWASFSSTSVTSTIAVPISAGQTVVTFPIYSEAVPASESVNVMANYEGTLENTVLHVNPYLSNLTVAPSTLVGGNTCTGTVTLVTAAPSAGLPVTVSTTSNLISFPNGATVTVGGPNATSQTSATFLIDTLGVTTSTQAEVTAVVGGYSVTQTITINPADISTFTFTPNPVVAGNTANGVVTLNGLAGTNLTLNITPTSVTGYTYPTTVVVSAGTNSGTFTVTTPTLPSNATVPFTVTNATSGVSLTSPLSVIAYSVQSLMLNPTEIAAGASSTATVTIAAPAPNGGVSLAITSSNPNFASVPQLVTIPSGQTTATFAVLGGFPAVNSGVNITAGQGVASQSAQLTVDAVPITLTLNPSEVPGGQTSTGTVSIPSVATTAITVNLTSTLASVVVPASVTIPAGSTSATFTITTQPVANATSASIMGTYQDASGGVENVSAQTLTIDAVGIGSIVFAPNPVYGGSKTLCTITLTGNSIGTTTILLSQTNPYLILPASVTIASGSNTVTFPVQSLRVSRNVSTTVSASVNGAVQQQSVVTVLRRGGTT